MLSCCIPLLFYDVVMYRAMVIQLLSLMHLKQKMLILVLVCMQLLLALEFILLVPYYLINSCCAGGTMNLVCQKTFLFAYSIMLTITTLTTVVKL
jgi:hypothetical protein